jgi:hypothetical protein
MLPAVVHPWGLLVLQPIGWFFRFKPSLMKPMFLSTGVRWLELGKLLGFMKCDIVTFCVGFEQRESE